jgi:hypothetical protein
MCLSPRTHDSLSLRFREFRKGPACLESLSGMKRRGRTPRETLGVCEESPRKEEEAEREEREGQKGTGKSTWVSKADLLHFFNFSSVSARLLLLRCMARDANTTNTKWSGGAYFKGEKRATSTSHPQTHKESGNGIKAGTDQVLKKRFSGNYNL